MKKEYKLRHPVVSGLFYPDRREELKKEIETYLGKIDREALNSSIREQTGISDPTSVQPVAIIAPHAGYIFSGTVQAYSYALLQPFGIETVVIIGPTHQTRFEGISVGRDDAYRTPLGEIKVDLEFAKKLTSHSSIFKHQEGADLGEHAIEVQVPFIQFVLPKAKIVPVLIGEQNRENAIKLGEAIAAAVEKTGKNVLIVASTDLSHYHSHADAQTLDNSVIEHVRNVDPDALFSDIEDGKGEACGFGGILTGLYLSRELGQGKSAILQHTDSGEVSGDRRKVVGYLSAVLY